MQLQLLSMLDSRLLRRKKKTLSRTLEVDCSSKLSESGNELNATSASSCSDSALGGHTASTRCPSSLSNTQVRSAEQKDEAAMAHRVRHSASVNCTRSARLAVHRSGRYIKASNGIN